MLIRRDNVKIFKDKYFIKLFYFLIAIVIYFTFTLSYSIDVGFGLKKLTYFFIGNFVVIFCTYYLFNYKLDFIISKGIYFLAIVGCLTVPIIVVFSPFEFGTTYKFDLTRWSHVFYSRFIGNIFLIWFIFLFVYNDSYFFNRENKVVNYYNRYSTPINCLIIVILALGIYLSGSRASIIFILLIATAIFIYTSFKKQLKSNKVIYYIIFVGTILCLAYFLKIGDEVMKFRYESFFELTDDLTKTEGSVTTRLALKEVAIEMFLEKPFFGYGLGSFYSYKSEEYIKIAKYPHNIFLEAGAELGILGVFVILILIILILKNSYKISIYLFFYFLYPLGLALFSKDISTQTLLWTGLAFIFIRGKKLDT
ncbi:MAG: O-antigen ligase family protein [Ignavibacteria bacterium]|nr:O-antigen ligase family protein [Ignavibacteria bacterium]